MKKWSIFDSRFNRGFLIFFLEHQRVTDQFKGPNFS